MTRTMKKILAGILAVTMVMSGSGMSTNGAIGGEAGKNGQYEIIEESIYDGYQATSNMVVMATNMDGENYTADSEICIVREDGEKVKFSNENEDGTMKYSCAEMGYAMSSASNGLFLIKENEGRVLVDDELNFIGENKDYRGFFHYVATGEDFYVATSLETINDDGEYSYDIIDKDNNVIAENAFAGDGDVIVFQFDDMYLVYIYNSSKIIVLDKEFKEIYSDEAYDCMYYAGLEYFVYISSDNKLYSLDFELNKNVIELPGMETIDVGHISDWFVEDNNYSVLSWADEDTMLVYRVTDAKTAVLEETQSNAENEVKLTEEGVYINDTIITFAKIATSMGYEDVILTEDDVYVFNDDLFVEIWVWADDFAGSIILAKEHGYSMDNALVLVEIDCYMMSTDKDDMFIVDTPNEGVAYIPVEGGWITAVTANYSDFVVANDEDKALEIYNYDLKHISSISYEEVAAVAGEGYEVTECLGVCDIALIIGVYNEETQEEKVVLSLYYHDYDMDKAVVLMDGEYEFLYVSFANFIYKDQDGTYVNTEDGWGNVIEFENERCVYMTASGEKMLIPNVLYDDERIKLGADMDAEGVVGKGDILIIKEEQEDGSVLYGLVRKVAADYGDANGDGKINVMDAVLMKKHIAGFENLTIELDACDVNVDGRVNVMDAVMVLKYIAGFDVVLGK